MNTTYTAVTIGPIYDTFLQVKRTRAIWAASYFYSCFMREMLRMAIDKKWKIMLPYKKKIEEAKYGSGLYADRLYFINKKSKKVQGLADKMIARFAKDFAKEEFILDNSKKTQSICSEQDARSFLKNYLNIKIVEISLSKKALQSIKADSSVLKILNDLLDSKELSKNYVFDIDKNYLIDYLTVKWNSNSLIKVNAFGKDNQRYFRSIGEIATSDLYKGNEDIYNKNLRKDFRNEDIELIDLLKTDLESQFKEYHKYYAVLYADGDNIGALLKSVANDDKKLQTFSKKLLDFGLKAEESIYKYGGNGIYLGGEDILAFLPVAYNERGGEGIKSLAHLIEALDRDFYDTLGEYAEAQGVKKTPTLSYGMMIAYYKYPMREAMQQAHDLMLECKNNKTLFEEKNGIAVRFQKHSGQYTQCHIDKSKKDSTQKIYELLTQKLQSTDKKSTLSGLIHRLQDDLFFAVFINAVRNNRSDAFFKNFFNETVHAQDETLRFIDSFNELVKALKRDYLTGVNSEEKIKDENKRFRNLLFTVMRYYHFLQPE
jgi:CRISPR-associated protein Cmr2